MSDINVILAKRSGTGTIRLCGCNCIHLNLGPVTINMEPEMFAQAAILMQQAMESLSEIVTGVNIHPASQAKPN
ncbi:hypothetical protein [Silvibacterium acidisoli]|uniref:hypothetical protein n=1 Tax=Acidobacteriaceae bacterium ZG23-2 TaxID=2883246 RepID=UPI00406CD9BF